jgi:mannan endo-1,4-beta-mannosidase
VAAIGLALVLAAPAAAQDELVRVDGTALVVNGEPFSFVGANVAVMHGPAHRAALETTLDAVVADGGRVVRFWALGEAPEDAPAWTDDFALWRGPHGSIAASFAHLDRVLEACRARGLFAIVVLANRWSDYGGLPQYLRWADVPFELDEHGVLPELSLPLFFGSARARALYLAHVERIVGRTNERTGVAYRDDPTILAWELFNEISAPPRARAALVAVLEESAARVHALDPNHLVSAGHVGWELSRDERTFEAAISARGIDYADAHAYPAAYGRVRALTEIDAWVAARVATARRAGRPLVFGEVGFTATRPRVLGGDRARALDRFLRAARRAGAAGVLPWIYAPSEDAPSEHALLVDGPIERTADLRRVLARHARRFSASDPREARAPRPRASVHVLSGSSRAHHDWTDEAGVRRLRIAPASFARAEFEAGGRFEGAPSDHVFGSGAGLVRYRFAAPPGRAARTLTVRVRASSELPGRGVGATAEDTSDVVVRLDGTELGRARLPVDDGVGGIVEVTTSEPAVLRRLRAGAHALELAVEDEDAPGLCLYGRADDASLLRHLELTVE